MVTGFELDQLEVQKSIARSLNKLAVEIMKLNVNLEKRYLVEQNKVKQQENDQQQQEQQ